MALQTYIIIVMNIIYTKKNTHTHEHTHKHSQRYAARDTAANGKLPAAGPLVERLTGSVGVRNGPQPNGSAGGSSFLPGGGGSGSSTGMAGSGASVPLPDLGIAAAATLPPASGAPSTVNGGAGGTASAKSAKPPSGNLINFNGPNEPQTQLTSPNPSPQHSLGEGNLLDKSNDSGSPGGSTKSKSLHNNDSKRKSKNKEGKWGVLGRGGGGGTCDVNCNVFTLSLSLLCWHTC